MTPLPAHLIPKLPAGCRPFTERDLTRRCKTVRVDEINFYERPNDTVDSLIADLRAAKEVVFNQFANKTEPLPRLEIDYTGPDYEGIDTMVIFYRQYETDHEMIARLNLQAARKIVRKIRAANKKTAHNS